MGAEIQPWRPSTTCSPEQMVERAKGFLQCETSPREALQAAKQLIGCFPHARPPDPETYAAAIAATFAQYPLQVARECCDPRTGLPTKREFPPTVASIVEWCDNRLAFHQAVAAWKPRPKVIPQEFSEEHCAEMRRKIAELPKPGARSM